MDPSLVNLPPLKDLSIENITDNTVLINSGCEDRRMKYVMERLVTHLHDFARETRLSTDEWMAGIQFLTQVGQICSDVRQVCRTTFRNTPTCLKLAITNTILPGIYPSLRCPWSLTSSGLDRPPQTHRLDRGFRPRSLPHARSRGNHSWWHTLTRC